MKTKNNIQGFSLIELMLVITLVAIFLLMAVPSIRVYLENTKVRNAAESMEKGLQKARFHALNRNHLTQFVINDAGDGWTIREQVLATDATGTTTPTARAVETFVWGAGGSNWAVDTDATEAGQGAANAVTFNGMGRLVANTDWLAPPTAQTGPAALTNPMTRIDVTSSSAGMTGVVPLRVDIGVRGIRVCNPAAANSQGC